MMPRRTFSGREYRSWSFWDRSFIVAVGLSILWHFFWFFSIKIVVSTPKKPERPRPYLVSLGPVMGDTIFKTLVETKPELSQSFYRRPSDLAAATELPAAPPERHAAGDVVSVPFGRKFLETIKGLVGGTKPVPDFDLSEEEKKKRLRLSKAFEG